MKTTSFVFLVLFCLVSVTSLASDNIHRFSLSEPVSGERLVSDLITGLVWQKTHYETYYTWLEALLYCESLTYGGYSDWRLPNKKELMSLVDYDKITPASDYPGFNTHKAVSGRRLPAQATPTTPGSCASAPAAWAPWVSSASRTPFA